MANPWYGRRALLEELWTDSRVARLSDVFEDGQVLYDAVVEYGLEGVVAKRHTGVYRPGYRGWTKIKNPSYWRRESEIAQMERSREGRGAHAMSV
jgi:ATP-dependent DNA ligase